MGDTIRIIDGIEDFNSVAEEWDTMVSGHGADIYLSSAWIAAWWRQFGSEGTRLIVIGFYDENGSLTGGIPLTVTTVWAGPIPVRLARIAASDINYGYLRLPVPISANETVWKAVFDRLFAETKADFLTLSPISEACPNLTALERAISGSDAYQKLPYKQERIHTLMRLPDSFDTFLASLSKSRRTEYKKDLKRLSKLATITNKTSVGNAAIERFPAFVDQHTAQWEAVNRPGHFGDWPNSTEFYADVIENLRNTSKARFDEQFADDHLLSSQFCFIEGKTCYWRLTSRTLDDEFMKHGAGKVGLIQRVEQLISEGIELVEAGAGHYGYKNSFGGEEVALHHILISPRKGLAPLKARLFIAWSDLFNLLYYRLWVLKIAPKLGPRNAPLWKSWIRTRL